MDDDHSTLAIRLLGRFEVLRNGVRIREEAWGRRKTEAVFKVLLTEPGKVFSKDQLLEALFPGEDLERALNNLYGRISQLRRALEPGLERGVDSVFIQREGQGYRFNVEGPCWIDTVEFAKSLAEGERCLQSGQNSDATRACERAIELYRGDFLEADRYEEWALEAREVWQESYVSALTSLADAYASAGDRHRAVGACRVAFDLRTSRESVLQQLMRYYHAAGNRVEALIAYERGVEAMKRDLDVEPSAETISLWEMVRTGSDFEGGFPADHTRIAVLPLVNRSPDPEDDYFADGMTEELIYSLSGVPGLKVIAQTSSLSYRGTKKTVAQIGRELNIGSVLEGSARKAGEKLRITLQLIDVSTEEHLWSRQYDREIGDVFAIQSEIAQEVATALRVRLLQGSLEELNEEPTPSLEAYTLYLKGRHFLRKSVERSPEVDLTMGLGAEGLDSAIDYFTGAIRTDPTYALAWSGLANAHCLQWFLSDAPDSSLDRAHEAAVKSVHLAPNQGDGYGSQALVEWIGRKDLGEAERLLKRATALSPRNPTLHHWLSRILRQLNRRGEAMLEILRASEIDPISPAIALEFADIQADTGKSEDAIKHAESVLELDPSHIGARRCLATLKMLSFDWEGAERECLAVIDKAPRAPFSHIQYAELLLSLGRMMEGRAALEQGVALAEEPHSADIVENIALLRYMLGDTELALKGFRKAIEMRPRFRFAYWWSAISLWRLGQYTEALEMLRKVEETADGFYRLSRDDIAFGVQVVRGMVFASAGDRAQAEAALEQMRAFPEGMPRRALGISAVLFHSGKIDEGFEWLQRAVEERCPNLRVIRSYTLPENVKKDPRYAEILEPTGLLAYAR